MCLLTVVLLVFPGTVLDLLWRLNPAAHLAFQSLENWSVVIMVTVGTACAVAAFGLWRARRRDAPFRIRPFSQPGASGVSAGRRSVYRDTFHRVAGY